MSPQVPRILVTGSTGQIGWELLRTLAPLGDVVGVSSRTAPLAMDLADPDSIRGVVREVKPALIVNAAAYTAVDRAESEPDIAMAVNGRGPGVLAEEAKRSGIPLVHYSTDYVFDGTSAEPYTERDLPNPRNVYGRTKLAGEQAIQAVGGRFLIFRTSWLYGARGKNFLLTMLRLMSEGRELRVVDDQLGCPTWGRMVAQATALVLARGGDVFSGGAGVYHLCGQGQASWCQFAQEIAALATSKLGADRTTVVPISTAQFPTPAARPKYSVMSTQRVSAELGVVMPDWHRQLGLCMADMAVARPRRLDDRPGLH